MVEHCSFLIWFHYLHGIIKNDTYWRKPNSIKLKLFSHVKKKSFFETGSRSVTQVGVQWPHHGLLQPQLPRLK